MDPRDGDDGMDGGEGTDDLLIARDPLPQTAEEIKAEVDVATAEINEKWTKAQENILAIGRYLVVRVFRGSAAAALDPRKSRKNGVYAKLLARAGTRKLLPNRKALSIALRLGAFDKLVTGGFYSSLDVGRRIELLPLGQIREMQEGAQHALEKDVSRANLRLWVANRLRHLERRTRRRAPSFATFARPLERVHESFLREGHLDRFAELVSGLPPEERAKIRGRMKETVTALQAALKTIR